MPEHPLRVIPGLLSGVLDPLMSVRDEIGVPVTLAHELGEVAREGPALQQPDVSAAVDTPGAPAAEVSRMRLTGRSP